MNAAHQDLISDSSRAAKKLLDEVYATLSQVNVLYNGAPDYKTAITQGEIDTVPSLAGLTKQQLDDAEFALASILGTLNGALPALSVLANLP